MAKGAVRKRCVDCRRYMTGDRARAQWCNCGGEMRTIPYGRRKVRARARR